MEKIIISACLVGDKCKYNAQSNYTPLIEGLKEKYDLILVCPEVMGGLTTPRKPCEIRDNKVININGKDMSKYFDKGVATVLNVVKYFGIKKAVLKEKSPSCGVKKIYDGSFNSKLIDGNGWLTKELLKLNVDVFNEEEIDKLLN